MAMEMEMEDASVESMTKLATSVRSGAKDTRSKKHSDSSSGVRRGRALDARDSDRDLESGCVARSDDDEDDWRSIREPIPEDFAPRGPSELDRRRNGRRPSLGAAGGGERIEGDRADDASGIYSKAHSVLGADAAARADDASGVYSTAGSLLSLSVDRADDASGFYSKATSVLRGAGSAGANSSHVGKKSWLRQVRKDAAPEEEVAGGRLPNFNNDGIMYCEQADMRNHPKGGRPKKDKESDLEARGGYADHRSRVKFGEHVFRGRQSRQQLEQQQQRQAASVVSKGSVASKRSVASSPYNTSAATDLRRKSNRMMCYAVMLMVALSFLMAILEEYYQARGVNLARAIFLGEEGADDTATGGEGGAGETAIALVKLVGTERASAEGGQATGGEALLLPGQQQEQELQQQPERAVNIWSAGDSFEKLLQAQEERARQQEERAVDGAVNTQAAVGGEPPLQGQHSPSDRGDVGERAEGIPPMTEAELAAREEAKALLEASRQRAQKEEEERAAREGAIRQHLRGLGGELLSAEEGEEEEDGRGAALPGDEVHIDGVE